jgi:translation initiation factor 2 subunit 1
MMKRSEYPVPGELVVIKITRIVGYGAFGELLEYGGKEGFIHISNIASSWIKNIRSHINEGQIRVASVVRVDKFKKMIDVSLRKVSSSQEKRKINEWKRGVRAEKLLELAAKEANVAFEKAYQEIAPPLSKEFGELFAAFESASISGEEAFKGVDIDKKWIPILVKLAEKNVTVSMITIKGKVTLRVPTSDGVYVIRKALGKPFDEGVSIKYVTAPTYSIAVTASDYEEAEEILDKTVNEIKSSAGSKAQVMFEREQSK